MSKASWQTDPQDLNACRPAFDLQDKDFDDKNQVKHTIKMPLGGGANAKLVSKFTPKLTEDLALRGSLGEEAEFRGKVGSNGLFVKTTSNDIQAHLDLGTYEFAHSQNYNPYLLFTMPRKFASGLSDVTTKFGHVCNFNYRGFNYNGNMQLWGAQDKLNVSKWFTVKYDGWYGNHSFHANAKEEHTKSGTTKESEFTYGWREGKASFYFNVKSLLPSDNPDWLRLGGSYKLTNDLTAALDVKKDLLNDSLLYRAGLETKMCSEASAKLRVSSDGLLALMWKGKFGKKCPFEIANSLVINKDEPKNAKWGAKITYNA